MWEAGGLIAAAIIGAAGGYFASQQSPSAAGHKDQAKNRDLQKRFAQKGVQWRVKDAKKAGIHPLAALGANTISYQPQSVFGGGDNTDWASIAGDFGQNISRAMSKIQTWQEREAGNVQQELEAENLKQAKLATKGMELEYQQKVNEAAMPPMGNSPAANALGVVGQDQGLVKSGISPNTPGSPPGVQFQPSQVILSQKPGLEAGIQPLQSVYINKDGTAYLAPNQQASEAMENDKFTELKYFVGNVVDYGKGWAAYTRPDRKESRSLLEQLRRARPAVVPEGKEWRYNPYKGAFELYEKRGWFFYDGRGKIMQ